MEAAEKAQQFLAGMNLEDFTTDEKTAFTVVRALEIIGEASSRLPEDVRDLYSRVPWRIMTDMRNILIHNYDDTDLKIVWRTVVDDIPSLIALWKERRKCAGSCAGVPRQAEDRTPHSGSRANFVGGHASQ